MQLRLTGSHQEVTALTSESGVLSTLCCLTCALNVKLAVCDSFFFCTERLQF
jgi:hypothetical protein